jgi:hypothetical protein
MRAVPAAFATLLVALPLAGGLPAAAQETPPASGDDALTVQAEQRELDELLSLTLVQQKQKAQELIRKYPGTPLSRTLQRLIGEYETFDRIADAERQAREARTACYRAYWRDRCCFEPAWNPPQARLVNPTADPILYEIRIGGIHRTLWMGPYRLRAGTDYASPHPYCVRFLTAGGVQMQEITPGETFAFQGSPAEGSLSLVPAPGLPAGGAAVPPPAPMPPALEPAPTPEPTPADSAEGPAMLP